MTKHNSMVRVVAIVGLIALVLGAILPALSTLTY